MNNPKSDPIDFIKFLSQYYYNINNSKSFLTTPIIQSDYMGVND